MTLPDLSADLASAEEGLDTATTVEAVEAIRLAYLGRKGRLTSILRGIKLLPEGERRAVGEAANAARVRIEMLLSAALERLGGDAQPIDTSLPGSMKPIGHLHLVTRAIDEITAIFQELGFTRVRQPEIESDWFAFEALNMPIDHPARDEWETFFIDHPAVDGQQFILTPHATSGTARSLLDGELPLSVINIQRTYRRQIDASHTPMFHQFDGLLAGEDVTFRHLKGVLEYFVKRYFGPEREVRLRPFHFRFTEPSFEVDISCGVCNGKGCRLCKDGWLELGGAGMLHPNVLRAAKRDPRRITALAFGWGVERTLLMKSGLAIPDIRILYENDVRFLEQF